MYLFAFLEQDSLGSQSVSAALAPGNTALLTRIMF